MRERRRWLEIVLAAVAILVLTAACGRNASAPASPTVTFPRYS